jgi:prevent-host-death family protein
MIAIHMKSEEAERDFAGLLGSVYNTHVPVIIEQKDLPMGVLISLEQFEQYEAFRKAEKERFWQVVSQIQDRQKDEDPEETLRFVTEIVEEVRQERYDKWKSEATGDH